MKKLRLSPHLPAGVRSPCQKPFGVLLSLVFLLRFAPFCLFTIHKSRQIYGEQDGTKIHTSRMRSGVESVSSTTLKFSCHSSSKSCSPVISARMGLITGLCAFLYHLPQIYKWLLKPYYLVSFFMTIAFLVVRKAPGLCEHLVTEREDGNSCDFDWVSARVDPCWLPAKSCC